MKDNIKLSIITPVFNGERYIERCYQNICNQTHRNWEWILVNDGSTDDTFKIAKKISDPRIKIISYDKNRGRGIARNIALNESSCDWVVVWDIDDLHFSRRLSEIAEAALNSHDYFHSSALLVNSKNCITGLRVPTSELLIHPTLACKADIIKKIGYSELETVGGIGEDYKLIIKLMQSGNGKYSESPLTLYFEESEIFLKKAIHSHGVFIKTLISESALNYGIRFRMISKELIKLVLLNALRINPNAYKYIIKYRKNIDLNIKNINNTDLDFIKNYNINFSL